MKPENKTNKPLKTAGSSVKPTTKRRFSARQFRLILIGLLCVVSFAFIAVAYEGLNSLSSKSQQLVDTKLKSKAVDDQLTALEQAKKDVLKYSYFNDVAKTVIPNDKDQAPAVLDIFQLAAKSGFSIASITFPISNLGTATSASSATASGSSATAISQAMPVAGITGLYSLELVITPKTNNVSGSQAVTYPKFLSFLKRIEKDRRTAQITGIDIQPITGENLPPDAINFTLTINIFMRPSK